jgi:GT2 family glycosyltransferase
MTGPTPVAVVVVSYNSRDDVLRCLGSLPAEGRPLEVVVVDNASGDGSAEAVRAAFPRATVIDAGANLGFAAASNRGARASRAGHLLFLNPDTEVEPGAVDAMAALLDGRPDVGVVGPAVLNADGTPQVSTGPFLTLASEWRQRRLVKGVARRDPEALRAAARQAGSEHEPDWVSGACLMVRRSTFEAVGGFDERFFLYEEDVDLCLRVRRAGGRIVFTPAARIRHRLGTAMAREPGRSRIEYERSHLAYYRKHASAASVLALRALMAAKGAALLGRSLLGPRAERRHAAGVLALALRGR